MLRRLPGELLEEGRTAYLPVGGEVAAVRLVSAEFLGRRVVLQHTYPMHALLLLRSASRLCAAGLPSFWSLVEYVAILCLRLSQHLGHRRVSL